MAPKGGIFFLLIVACAALAVNPNRMPGNKPGLKGVTKRLMKKCQEKGYPMQMEHLKTVFNSSASPMESKSSGQSSIIQSALMSFLASILPVKDSLSSVSMADKMKNNMWNCTKLLTMIRTIRNSSEASACYMLAILGPLSWETLTTQDVDNMDSDDYDMLLWAAKPALREMLSSRMRLPDKAACPKVKKMMKVLKEVYRLMPEKQRRRVVKWAKQQITENNFNCTTTNSSFKLMECCKPSLKWLSLETLTMMGPYLSSLPTGDVYSILYSIPKEKLCEFFRSGHFKSAWTKKRPSLAKRFQERTQECFSGKDIAKEIDKLGTLACYYDADKDLSPELSKKFLSQLKDCENSGSRKLRKRLLKSILSKSITTQALRELGSSVALLSLKQLSKLSGKDLKEFLKTTPVQWTQAQQYILAKKLLGNKCKAVSVEELKDLQSVSGGLPNCVLKHIKPQEMQNDTEVLNKICKRMRKGQLKAILEVLLQSADPSELVQKLTGALLNSMSLNHLSKVNITSLDQIKDKNWTRSQAAQFCLKKNVTISYRKLGSLIQGLTCEMIDKVPDSDVPDMVESMEDTPQYISKLQAQCVGLKFSETMEKKRPDYFKTITEDELDDISPFILIHLPPSKVKDLPQSVCPVFLDKMEVADLSSVPLRGPSRRTLTKRALLCLANGTDLSRLTTDQVSSLGQLLCELRASQLRLMAPDVLNSSLQAMASCKHIPRRNREDLIQLVNDTFGDPSDWSDDTMEEVGPLLRWDDNATAALTIKPWMKDSFCYSIMHLPDTSPALRKKCFDVTTTPNVSRKKREVSSDRNGGGKGNSSSTVTDSSSGNIMLNTKVPTVELIEELGKDNVFWEDVQLDRITDETFRETVETLGNITDYSEDQLAVLGRKAVKVFGPVSNMSPDEVAQMGCITRGFLEVDLQQLPIPLEMLDQIAHCGWNETQMEAMWKSIAKYNNRTAQQLDAAEMVLLSQFICGLNSSEIRQLSITAFKDAVGSMAGVQCSFKVAQQLKRLAVSAFGNPSTWTGARVNDLGNIIAGLNGTELASLDSSVCSFISESCIPLILPNNFPFFTLEQLLAFGPDNAAMVTSEQKAGLGDKKLAALENSMTGSRSSPGNPGDSGSYSGAPSLTVEGMSAFMKPLLFLLVGFLLL